MSNTLFAVLGSLAPVQNFLRRFGTASSQQAHTGFLLANRPRELASIPATESAHCAKARNGARARNSANMPLRVVRVMEAGQAVAHGGRMMISGRMADVCAELDRMVERESASHAGV